MVERHVLDMFSTYVKTGHGVSAAYEVDECDDFNEANFPAHHHCDEEGQDDDDHHSRHNHHHWEDTTVREDQHTSLNFSAKNLHLCETPVEVELVSWACSQRSTLLVGCLDGYNILQC